MILGVGVDILHLPRIEALVARRGLVPLARRILHPEEHDAFDKLDQPSRQLRFLAVRWAIKEAAYKAVQPQLQPTWKQFTFLPGKDTRKPVLMMMSQGRGLQENLIPKLHASVSHDGDYVNAYVIAERG
ncbi:4'-phosphopantetheinyl transferase [Clavulina sp. PMI_390]|nr:4'-phosphopantetheinyl transferase [Clavulina sp. PMI_390]